MSRASAAVLFADGTIKYAMYCGTSDVLWPRLFDTADDAWDAYRSTKRGDIDAWYKTFHPAEQLPKDSGEPVRIYEDYGGGSEWPGFATRDYVTSQCDPYEIDDDLVTHYTLDTNPPWLVWKHADEIAKTDQPSTD